MKSPYPIHVLLLIIVLTILACTDLPVARAASTITVTTDSGGTGGPDCTLRDAITAANTDTATGGCPAGSGDDVIVLPINAVITLSVEDNSSTFGPNGLPLISSTITIQGNGTTLERAAGSTPFRFFALEDGGNLSLHNLVLTGGYARGNSSIKNNGGAIHNFGGQLNISNSTLTGNQSYTDGGAICSYNGVNTLTDVILSNNVASGGGGADGGAIILHQDAQLSCTNCTMTGNSADMAGSAITFGGQSSVIIDRSVITANPSSYGVIYSNSNEAATTMTVTNSLIADNQSGIVHAGIVHIANSTIANHSSFALRSFVSGNVPLTGVTTLHNVTLINNGIGIDHNGTSLEIANSIIAGNVDDCDGNGSAASLGFNILGDDPDCPIDANDTTLAGLGLTLDDIVVPLADNGGPTQTHALAPSSPAIDAGNPAGCTDYTGTVLIADQRGIARPQHAACDIGAYEYDGNETLITGLVWEDANGDGLQDGGEGGIGDITLTLYDSGDLSTPLQTTASPQSGSYSFAAVVPGSYVVAVEKPSDRVITLVDVGSDNTLDSDFDRLTGQTPPIAVTDFTRYANWDVGLTTGVIPDTGSVMVVEGTLDATYTVLLGAPPEAGEMVTITPVFDAAQLSLSPGLLDFDAGNWDTPQTFTVTPVDDGAVEGMHDSLISHTVTTSGGAYDSLIAADITVEIQDNDLVGVIIEETDGSTTVNEAASGIVDTYTLVLGAPPATGEVVTITPVFDSAQIALGPASVQFDETDWYQAQTLTVTVVDDSYVEGSHNTTISHTVSTAGGSVYQGVTADDLSVAIEDDDTAGVIINPFEFWEVFEGGPAESYLVVLTAAPDPGETVTITLNYDDTQINPSPTVIEFTDANWDQAEPVAVIAVDDDDIEGSHSSQINHVVATSGGAYSGVTANDVLVWIYDDDFAGARIAQSDGTTEVDEANVAATDSYTLTLGGMPTADVQATLSTDGQCTITAPFSGDSGSVTFPLASWDTPHTITVAAVDDTIDEFDLHSCWITHSLSSADQRFEGGPVYAGGGENTLIVTVFDDDTADPFIVNTTNDDNDGTCDDTHCSLREAIIASNTMLGLNTIHFDISGAGPHTIQPTTELPEILEPVTIDGTSEPDFPGTPIVVIDGSNLTDTNMRGLVISSGYSIVRGLVISNFGTLGSDGLYITSGGNNVVEGCYIGTDVTGLIGHPNYTGIIILDSDYNRIGGDTPEAHNIISGNNRQGIYVGSGSSGTIIIGNYIGLGSDGVTDVGNGTIGIQLSGASSIRIGGPTPAERNIISGNNQDGIQADSTYGFTIQGNYIGTDSSGTIDVGNSYIGVDVDWSSGTIGGTGTGEGNLISGNNRDGIQLISSGGVSVKGNLIGTDSTGTAALGNTMHGIDLDTNATIGGTSPGAGNVISGNGENGIFISMHGDGAKVYGNLIGTDLSGTTALGNAGYGIRIVSATGSRIANNVISGNGGGLWIRNYLTSDNIIWGNLIGTDITGTAPLGNVRHGIFMSSGLSDNTVGGLESNQGNIIAYNGLSGIYLERWEDSDYGGNSFLSNAIFDNGGLGIDLGEAGVTPNDTGDGDTGVNHLQNFPVVSSVETDDYGTIIAGTLDSTPNTDFTLQFFANSTCDPSGYGEGESYIGYTEVTTDGGGDTSFSTTFPVVIPAEHYITATATDSNGNTSEFSFCAPELTTPPGSVILISPLDGDQEPNPTYTWEARQDANQYHIVVSDSTSTVIIDEWHDAINICDYTTCSVTPSVLLEQGNHTWKVQAANYAGMGVWSSEPSFYVSRTIVVNVTDDTDDGQCTEAHCSLREAIQFANARPGTDIIHFDIAGTAPYTIRPNSHLPTITETLILDGTSEPDFTGTPIIELEGSNAGNNVDGLTLNADDSIIRGLVINRFSRDGLRVYVSNNVVIEGNYIGTDVTGTIAHGNGNDGLLIGGTVTNSRFGGTTPAQRNIISGNGLQGIETFAHVRDNVIIGNYIGTDVTGMLDLGNGRIGIFIRETTYQSTYGNTIGGTEPGAGNLISGNDADGINITGSILSTTIQGNKIGTDITGTSALPNDRYGILVSGTTIGTLIGEADNPAAGNTIAYNGLDGICVAVQQTSILGNSITSNGTLGIELTSWPPDGVTPNDPGDVDTGANGLQNFPELSASVAGGSSVQISGELNSKPNLSYHLEFFSNQTCDPSGHGEGETFLGSLDVTTGADGKAIFSTSYGFVVPEGQFITSTATDPDGNTSEFSACSEVMPLNNSPATARIITTPAYHTLLDTTAATTVADDPILPCGPADQGHHSIWYAITPAFDGMLSVDSFGSDYNTVLAVWTGSPGSFQNEACNDDAGSGQQSQLELLVNAGTTYYIEVAGYNAADFGQLNFTVSLAACYAVSVAVNEPGFGDVSVIPAPNCGDGARYLEGTQVEVTATANTGYVFASWSGDASGSSNPLTLIVDDDTSITANFTELCYSLAATGNPSDDGAVTINTPPNCSDGVRYLEGTSVEMTADPATGFEFDNWSGDASGTDNPLTITMDADKTITANFTVACYSLTTTAIPSEAGVFSANPAPNCHETEYTHGTVVELTITPNAGYHFDSWGGDAGGSENPISITMDGDKTITANFLNCYTLSVVTDPADGGHVRVVQEPNCGADQYIEGSEVTLTAQASTGYLFSGWSGDGSGAWSPLSVVMDGDKSITALFSVHLTPVDEVTINVGDAGSTTVEVVISGNLPDSCTRIHRVDQSRTGNLVEVQVISRRPSDKACAAVIAPYSITITLEGEYPPGDYVLIINGVEYAFSVT